MFLSRRRGVPEPEADAASVAMLTSPGVDVTAAAAFFARAGVARLTGAFFAAAFLTGAFLAAVFPAALLVRTGRSLMADTSLSDGSAVSRQCSPSAPDRRRV